MKMLSTTDNNGGNYRVPEEHCDNLLAIGNRNVGALCQENPDLLIFPQSLGLYHDDIAKAPIFVLQDGILTTRNMMGFVGKDETRLTISSRFCKNDQHDYFLHYMLQRVFAINMFNFEQTSNDESVWDFLLYLFPYYLKQAFRQGIYRTYVRTEYNDAHVKGRIDVNRHIRMNFPFRGQIAYSTREYSVDNPIIQLIRHTIEYISNHPLGKGVLTSDAETRDVVDKIRMMTQTSYRKNDRQQVMAANLKRFSHPYFTAYVMLQKICMQILRRDKISFGEKESKIYGLLFDGAWLWEEYLNTVLKQDFEHPENKTGKHRRYLFNCRAKSFQAIYPDFISKNSPTIVGDAKYIALETKEYNEDSERATSVYYKTITYMYRFKSTLSFLLFPHPRGGFDETYEIKETAGKLRKIGLSIPQNETSFAAFQTYMRAQEEWLRSTVRQL